MKKLVLLSLIVAIICFLQFQGCDAGKPQGIEAMKKNVSHHIEAFSEYLTDSLLVMINQKSPAEVLQTCFIKSRILYKRIEWATEYFMPVSTRFINGPPLPEVENEEHKIRDAEGLQVIENILFADSVDFVSLNRELRLLIANINYVSNYWKELQLDTAQVLDAAKLQIFRIISLGISGFDAPLAKSSIPEAVSSLRAIKEVLEIFEKNPVLSGSFDKAIQYLESVPDFENFDRLPFIRSYSLLITKAITAFQHSTGTSMIRDVRLLKPSAESLFDTQSFDVNAYAQDSSYYFTEAKARLGEKIFSDPILSLNKKISCASCHQPEKVFTDGLITSLSVKGVPVRRNAPTLLYAALQPWQFYDMRTTSLENQSGEVISNKDEMHGNLDEALQQVVQIKNYQTLFAEAFPNQKQFTGIQLKNALASYVRSLPFLNSRFDKYMRGENNIIITNEEKQGFNLFMGKAKCGTCHFMPLFNGTIPPSYQKMESEVIGVPSIQDKKVLDADLGRYAIFKMDPYLNAFKTTTVRNATKTAPYMHNGVFKNLEEVTNFYNLGGGLGQGIPVSNQTLPPEKLLLTRKEIKALIAFIRTLEDEKR